MSMSEQHWFGIKSTKIINFLSGLTAGVISVTICNPLDIARTRLNVLNAPSHQKNYGKYMHFSHAMQTIWKEQGLRGFYNGYRTNVIAVPIFHSFFFPLYEFLKQKYLTKNYNHNQAYLISTFLAGSICNIILNPIWVVRTRLMAQHLHHEDHKYNTNKPFVVLKQMYQKEGLHSLFKGLIPSLFSVSNAMIYFFCYEHFKTLIGSNLTVTNIFFASTVSKIIASALTYPIVAVRTVMFDFRGRQKSHFINIVSYILRENGVKGFYAGLKPDLVRLIPSNAIVFIVYQKLKKFL